MSCDNQLPESNRHWLLYFTIDSDGQTWRLADMQGISCLDAERGKNKSGPCFLSKRQRKLNHADSFSSTNWRANWRLCALRDKLNHLLSPRNYMCILLIYLPCIFVEIIITASLFLSEVVQSLEKMVGNKTVGFRHRRRWVHILTVGSHLASGTLVKNRLCHVMWLVFSIKQKPRSLVQKEIFLTNNTCCHFTVTFGRNSLNFAKYVNETIFLIMLILKKDSPGGI